MIYYIYDGSFDGLLTAIYEAYYRREVPEKIICEGDYQDNFFVQTTYIDTDSKKAKKVYKSIQTKISNQALKSSFYAFLSEIEDAGTWIYKYLKFGWQVGKIIDSHITDERVLNIHNTKRKVTREIHYVKGLLRFRRIQGNVYYAPFEPEYNVLGLIAPHFKKRLNDQNWVIHDIKRGIGALYNQEEWIIKDINIKQDIKFAEEEILYQKLWKQYFRSIAIKNRINLNLQKKNMPMKYWKYLIEKN